MTNADIGYGTTAKALHWLIVAMLTVQYLLGWSMPDVEPGEGPGTIIDLHMSMGISILLVMAVRLAWRAMHPVPLLAELPLWQQRGARYIHLLLYVLILAMPLFGWFAAADEGWQASLYGIIALPVPAMPESALAEFGHEAHEIFGTLLLAVIALHSGAALYHYFFKRDRVLQRMLPGG